MRSFFFLLLVTNLAFLGWYLNQDHAEPKKQPLGLSDTGLALLSELPPEKRPALRDGAEPLRSLDSTNGIDHQNVPVEDEEPRGEEGDDAAAEVSQCLRIAGINEKALQQTLLERLRATGASGLKSGSREAQKTNYWVVLGPYPSRKKAAELATILRKKRIKDFYIVSSGEHKNTISLGVFSTREHALRRQAQIVDLKTTLPRPSIATKMVPGKEYWIECELKEAGSRETVDTLVRDYSLPQAEEMLCK